MAACRCACFSGLTQLTKEALQQIATRWLQYVADDSGAMIEAGLLQQIHQRAGASCFGIGGTVYDQRDSGLYDGPRAHRAWFEGDIEPTVQQPPCIEMTARLCDCDHFCMCNRTAQVLAFIIAASDHCVVMDDNGADGDFADRTRFFRLGDGQFHPVFMFRCC